MIDQNRWSWCDQCQCPLIECPRCGNWSCNGGGCDQCHADFEEATRMINGGMSPTEEWCKENNP
jgi:hypothetical protein